MCIIVFTSAGVHCIVCTIVFTSVGVHCIVCTVVFTCFGQVGTGGHEGLGAGCGDSSEVRHAG